MEAYYVPKVTHFDFDLDPSKVTWKEQILPVEDKDPLKTDHQLIKFFGNLLISGQSQNMINPVLESKSSLEKNLTENIAKLKTEVFDLNQFSQNLTIMMIEKNLTPAYPRRIVEREKVGFKMFNIQVSKNVTNQDDFSESVTALRDLASSLYFKKAVF